ncbi:hypothetical protein IFM89_014965 [Coptis chinensis]|uniref:Uncharacterized protein n=1 Tax=Coptis chinensis TaxID=261450 RepID=A0A835HHW3_9MAGN|nr:hypothetical protein IFM89_014965 [Coptis chinensis]
MWRWEFSAGHHFDPSEEEKKSISKIKRIGQIAMEALVLELRHMNDEVLRVVKNGQRKKDKGTLVLEDDTYITEPTCYAISLLLSTHLQYDEDNLRSVPFDLYLRRDKTTLSKWKVLNHIISLFSFASLHRPRFALLVSPDLGMVLSAVNCQSEVENGIDQRDGVVDEIEEAKLPIRGDFTCSYECCEKKARISRQCNVVICFDLAKTVLAYIQSRSRARMPGSDYILMVESLFVYSFEVNVGPECHVMMELRLKSGPLCRIGR